MILVHSIKGEEFYVNPNMIETIRSAGDTVLFLNTDKRYNVTDKAEEIVERIVAYQRRIHGLERMDESTVKKWLVSTDGE